MAAAAAAASAVASFGSLASGQAVRVFTLSAPSGLSCRFLDYGATLLSCQVPSSGGGDAEEVTLGYKTIEDIVAKSKFMGVTVGRYANRIAGGAFELDEEKYTLAVNNGPNSLHGGLQGFDKVVWDAEPYDGDDGSVGVKFSYVSKDGEEGYPGTLNVTADYSVTPANELKMVFRATTDKATPINMCNHAYWNLSGGIKADIKGHVLKVNASRYLPVSDVQIPTGELAPVAGTPYDLTRDITLGETIMDADGGGEPGIDHCYVIDRPAAAAAAAAAAGGGEGKANPDGDAAGKASEGGVSAMVEAARMTDPASGRTMVVTTTQPGVQVYTGNFLDKAEAAAPYRQHHALCLETQHFPDSVHHDAFPNAILRPGETFEERTTHAFSW